MERNLPFMCTKGFSVNKVDKNTYLHKNNNKNKKKLQKRNTLKNIKVPMLASLNKASDDVNRH